MVKICRTVGSNGEGVYLRTGSVARTAIVLWLATASLASAQCVGDCDRSGTVTIAELTTGVRIVLDLQPVNACEAFDQNADGAVTVAELVAGVDTALRGCSPATSTPTPSVSPTFVATFTPSEPILYQLTQQSSITIPAGGLTATGSPTQEPLSGTLTVVPQPRGGPYCFNVIICFAATDFHFESAHATVDGSDGMIIVSSFFPESVSARLTGTINGTNVELTGQGPFSPGDNLHAPPLTVMLSGNGYALVVDALASQ